MAEQFVIGDQVTCRVDSNSPFTDDDYTSEDGIVVYLRNPEHTATGPVPTIGKEPKAPTATGTVQPYGVLANRVTAFGDPTASAGSNQLTYPAAANATVSGIVAVEIPANANIDVDASSIGQGLGNLVTLPTPSTSDGLQPRTKADGGKGKIVARNGRKVYWDIRAT